MDEKQLVAEQELAAAAGFTHFQFETVRVLRKQVIDGSVVHVEGFDLVMRWSRPLALLLCLLVIASRVAAAEPGPLPNVVIIEYSATWCEVCKGMQPLVDAAERAGYPVHTADVDDERTKKLPGCPTDSVPTFVAVDLRTGKVLQSHTGRMQPQQFKAFVTKWTKPKPPAAPAAPAGKAPRLRSAQEPTAPPRLVVVSWRMGGTLVHDVRDEKTDQVVYRCRDRIQAERFISGLDEMAAVLMPKAPVEKPKLSAKPMAYQGKKPPRAYPERPKLVRSQGTAPNSPVVLHRSHSLDERSHHLADGLTPGHYWTRSYVLESHWVNGRMIDGNPHWTEWLVCEAIDRDGDGKVAIRGPVGFPCKQWPTVHVQFIRIPEPVGVPSDPPSEPRSAPKAAAVPKPPFIPFDL